MTDAEDNPVDVIFSAEVINKRVHELAHEIKQVGLDNLLVIAVLKGSFIFAADLIRALHDVGLSPEVDFISLSSYRTGTQSSGRVEILRDIDLDVAGRNVLLVDDILEFRAHTGFCQGPHVGAGCAFGQKLCAVAQGYRPRSGGGCRFSRL